TLSLPHRFISSSLCYSLVYLIPIPFQNGCSSSPSRVLVNSPSLCPFHRQSSSTSPSQPCTYGFPGPFDYPHGSSCLYSASDGPVRSARPSLCTSPSHKHRNPHRGRRIRTGRWTEGVSPPLSQVQAGGTHQAEKFVYQGDYHRSGCDYLPLRSPLPPFPLLHMAEKVSIVSPSLWISDRNEEQQMN
ncbi:hypothetical protein PMAYCL1PPCAC_07141, partial [Pristionchus mayeri]